MIRVVWTPIPLQFSNGKISQYKIEYGIAGYKMETILIPADRTQIDITSLRLGELYTVEVSAGTSAGFSSAAQTTIKIGDPDIAGKAYTHTNTRTQTRTSAHKRTHTHTNAHTRTQTHTDRDMSICVCTFHC